MKRIFISLMVASLLFCVVAHCETGGLRRYEQVEGVVTIKFYYVVAVTGPLARVIDKLVGEFNATHPKIKVEPVYCGDYDETLAKVVTAIMAGTPPDVFCVEISELYTILDTNGVIPLDPYIEAEGGQAFLDQFWPAFLGNSYAEGHVWCLPFQRSTPIFYWNKDLFAEYADKLQAAGLDPSRPPQTWEELEMYAIILTDPEKGQWGVILPGGWNDWIFEAFVYQNGGWLIDSEGKIANFDSPEVREVLEFWYKLTNVLKVSPPLRPWAQTPIDFAAGKAAMMYYSTGGLPTVRATAPFSFGTAFLPKNRQYGTPVGGGNLFISKDIPPENQDAAWEFIKFMTSPEIAARWSIESGYVCVNKLGLELPFMKEYLEKYPDAATAMNQLVYARPKIMARRFNEIRRVMTAALDDLMLGRSTPEEVQRRLQREVQRILEEF